jgi:mannose-1-phosphate guanylyltransferase
MGNAEFYSVILAGGSGTRLWPLSRKTHPKFLHALTGSASSLLQATAARLAPLSPPALTYVVTGAGHAAPVARQLPDLPDANLLIEPSPRDSCAAIGLAATLIARRDPDAVMGSFAADHRVVGEKAFGQAIRAAITAAKSGRLMTIGIKPTVPSTGYGYLQCGPVEGAGPVRSVVEFKEKPSVELAKEYLATGAYLWNAGMFVWQASTFLAELHRQQPDLWAGLSIIADAWGTDAQDKVLGNIWPDLTKISVDYGVMEGAADAGLVATVPGDFGWTDIGDFDAVGEVLCTPDEYDFEAGTGTLGALHEGGADEDGNVILTESKETLVLLRDTTGSVVVAQSGRLIATIGMDDLILVDTPDALLICPRSRAQDIKSLVDELRDRGEHKYL